MFIRENLGAPFIASFISLLMVAAVLSAWGIIPATDEVATYVFYIPMFYVLIVGVVLQFISFLKHPHRDYEEASDGSS